MRLYHTDTNWSLFLSLSLSESAVVHSTTFFTLGDVISCDSHNPSLTPFITSVTPQSHQLKYWFCIHIFIHTLDTHPLTPQNERAVWEIYLTNTFKSKGHLNISCSLHIYLNDHETHSIYIHSLSDKLEVLPVSGELENIYSYFSFLFICHSTSTVGKWNSWCYTFTLVFFFLKVDFFSKCIYNMYIFSIVF